MRCTLDTAQPATSRQPTKAGLTRCYTSVASEGDGLDDDHSRPIAYCLRAPGARHQRRPTIRGLDAVGRSGALRLFLGGLIGFALLTVTIARVDLGAAAQAVAGAALPTLATAVAIVLVDLAIRALRWQILLRGVGDDTGGPFRLVAGYLTIGYFGNLFLPARLGDVARAYLSGRAFGMSRLSSLGTIMVERVADGGTMLALAATSSFLVAGVEVVRTLAIDVIAVTVAAATTFVVALWVATRTSMRVTRIARLSRDIGGRLAAGLGATRTLVGATGIVITTAAAATTATLVGWLVAGSVGIVLTAPQAVLFVSAIALSLALPGAPGSLGTYEFAGVLILTSLGYPSDRAFATMVLMRVIATLPPVVLGIISLWALRLKPTTILGSTKERSQ
jgi:uncharacterized protein (TIRG00374 family)